MRKILLLVSFICCSLMVLAQKVEPGTRIINCSDMPVGTYTNIKRRCPVPDHWVGDRLNQTVYQRFEVAEHNYQNSALGTDRAEAKRLCAAYSESVSDRGKWRLPTQRELILIWILRPALAKNNDFVPLDQTSTSGNSYYSATRNSGVNFMVANGIPASNTGGGGATDITGNLVRCVRDLDIE